MTGEHLEGFVKDSLQRADKALEAARHQLADRLFSGLKWLTRVLLIMLAFIHQQTGHPAGAEATLALM